MKRNYLFSMMIAFALFLFSACESNDFKGVPNVPDVPKETMADIVSQFNTQYPKASNVSWTKKGTHVIAKFNLPASKAAAPAQNKAWFSLEDKNLKMSEIEINVAQLPTAIVETFKVSKYATADWILDEEVDVLKREGMPTIYVLEIEKKGSVPEIEIELFFTSDGVLVKEVVETDEEDDYEECLPKDIPEAISNWIKEKFPTAQIVDFENEENKYEVEFAFEELAYEVVFDNAFAWIYTEIEFENGNIAKAPQAIIEASVAKYPNAKFDEISKFIYAANNITFYYVEMEDAEDNEYELYFDEQGTELTEKPAI